MKVVFRFITACLIVFICYFLYQKQLGAIPFLILSFILFYLVYRITKPTIQKTDHKEETPTEVDESKKTKETIQKVSDHD